MNPVKHIKKEYLLDRMSQLVSSRFGIIQETYFRQNLIFGIPMAVSHCKGHIGIAADLDFLTAMMKSIAEALDRYSLDAKERHVLYKKTYKELKALGYKCFYPEEPFFEDFVYEKFSFCRQITSSVKTDWKAVTRLSDNQQTWLPASLIHYNAHKNFTNVLKEPSSNGVSCSFFYSAIESSLLELIERDTFLYMWLSKSTGEEIILDKVSNPSLKELISRIGCKIKQIKFVYKYTDVQIPCVFVLFRGKQKYKEPAFSVGGAADTDIERACYRALLEFTQCYNSFFFYDSFFVEQTKKRKANKSLPISSFVDHFAFYAMYENFSKCEFLFHTAESKKLSELSKKWPGVQEKIKLLKSCLKDKRVFIADVTPIEIAKTHISITRAYSPDLMDIDSRDDQAFSSSFRKKRVDTIDKIFKRRTERLNTDSHCFP